MEKFINVYPGDTDEDYQDEDDSPLCECQLDPMEDESASNCCSACGRPLQ